jgi:hypothetical protein
MATSRALTDTNQVSRALIARMLAEGSSGEPIGHWAQGLNRVAQSLFGGLNMAALKNQEAGARDAAISAFKSGNTDSVVQALADPNTPPALASLAADRLKPKSYGFMTAPDGTIYRTNPRDGTFEKVGSVPKPPTWGVVDEDAFGKKNYGWIDPYTQTTTIPGAQPSAGVPSTGVPAAGPTAPAAPLTVTGPGGEPIPIPPGVDPKVFRTDVTKAAADAATGKRTEVQAKSEKFGNRMELAEAVIREVEERGTDWTGRLSEGSESVVMPGIVNKALGAMASDDYKKYRTARDNFITATLRDESGAAIGTQEWLRKERELFPQPRDSKDVIAQKRRLREVEIQSMRKAAGPGYKPPKDIQIQFGSGTKPGGKNNLKEKYGLD